MAIICFDYGHGGSDPGAIYKGRKEKDDNIAIGKLVARRLRSLGVIVDEVRTGDQTISLKSRCEFERKKNYDYFISFHRNAFRTEEAKGAETHIYQAGDKRAKPLALSIQKKLKALGFVDRGVKESNFHVLRETRSPAILIELGFIDNSSDNEIFIKKCNEIVDAIAVSVIDVLGIKSKNKEKVKSKDIYYRVVTGSFESEKNAKKRKQELENLGFDSFITSLKS